MYSAIIKDLEALITLDVKTLIGVLVWCDLALSLLAFGYYIFHESHYNKKLIKWFSIAKILQVLAWFLIFLRGQINDIVSIYLGNILIYFSFYMDSIIMLSMMRHLKKIWFKLQLTLLVLFITFFLFFEISSGQGNVRIAITSIGIYCLLFVPTISYIFNKQSSRFKCFIGMNNFIFIMILLLRALRSLLVEYTGLFSNNLFQSTTFITLILLVFVNGAGFLLLMYEHTDELLRVSANLDPLTQISNRRNFMIEAEEYYHRCMREQKSLSFLFVDIDYFKKVNDNYGHLFGDEVLKTLAKVITENIRPTDLCCRFGGEEFLVLLPETACDEAVVIGNTIRKAVEKLVFEEKKDFKCTTSVGIYTDIPDNDHNIQHFIDIADQALYKAKGSGRNCVVAL